jgi:hypothetical protein
MQIQREFGRIHSRLSTPTIKLLLDGTPSPNTFISNTGSLNRPDLDFCHASLYGEINQENLESQKATLE